MPAKYRREGVYDNKEITYTHMAVQKKSNAGEKPEEKKINWMQVGVIAFCVLMVVMCVLSFANFQNFFGGGGASGAAEAGNPVIIQYKMYVGDTVVRTMAGAFIAGYTVNESIPVNIDENATRPYLLYDDEYNAISTGVIGMNAGETKTVSGSGKLSAIFTKDKVDEAGLKFEDIKVGDMLAYNDYYVDELGERSLAFRDGIVTEKTDKDLTLTHGTDKIEITFIGYWQSSA